MSAQPLNAALRIMRQPDHWVFLLNRPAKRNALSADLVEALLQGVMSALQEDVPLLVFQGEGRNFSAGFDFTDYEEQSEGDLLLRFVRIEMLLETLATAPCMTLALAQGRNYGAGADLFAACRRRICTSDASFRMPGLNFGLVLGSRRLRAIVGEAEALRILGESLSFDAGQARASGFVHDLADEESWGGIIKQAREAAVALDSDTRHRLYAALDGPGAGVQRQHDMAALVRSAARPGLKARIGQYLEMQKPALAGRTSLATGASDRT